MSSKHSGGDADVGQRRYRRKARAPETAGGRVSCERNVTVRSAGAAAPRTIPDAPSSPLGMSTAQVGIRRAFSDSTSASALPSKGRERPAPKIASITIPAPSRLSDENGATGPFQRPAAWAASPVSFSREPSRAKLHRPTRSRQVSRGDKAVAAVVSWPAQHDDRPHRTIVPRPPPRPRCQPPPLGRSRQCR